MSHLKWNVEHDYAGKSSISRGRTYTGWIRSLAGCTAFRALGRRRSQIVPTPDAQAGAGPIESSHGPRGRAEGEQERQRPIRHSQVPPQGIRM